MHHALNPFNHAHQKFATCRLVAIAASYVDAGCRQLAPPIINGRALINLVCSVRHSKIGKFDFVCECVGACVEDGNACMDVTIVSRGSFWFYTLFVYVLRSCVGSFSSHNIEGHPVWMAALAIKAVSQLKKSHHPCENLMVWLNCAAINRGIPRGVLRVRAWAMSTPNVKTFYQIIASPNSYRLA